MGSVKRLNCCIICHEIICTNNYSISFTSNNEVNGQISHTNRSSQPAKDTKILTSETVTFIKEEPYGKKSLRILQI